MPLKINIKSVLMYAVYAAAAICANYAVKGAPLSLGLNFSMLLCGTNILVTPAIFVLASAVNLNLKISLISLFQAVFLSAIVFIYRRTNRKIRAEAIVYLLIALCPYVLFAPWLGTSELLIKNEYALRGVAAGVCAIFCFFCFKSVYSLLFRLERCRLKEDEIICLAVVYAVCGAGLCSALGLPFYYCAAAIIITFFTRLLRSPAVLLVPVIVAIPPATVQLSFTPLTAILVISVLAFAVSGIGRFAAGTVCGALTGAFSYLSGFYNCPVPMIVLHALLLALACILPSLPKDDFYKNLKCRLMVEDALPETTVARNRRMTGEKLFRISEVFREIEVAFLALDENVDDSAARARMLEELKEKCCKACEKSARCRHTGVYTGFKKLIDAGCVKGRVNLIDLPSEMTVTCSKPTDVLMNLNALLTEYRRSMTETENARSGRRLLADQAHGVAEVMKGCAVELSRSFEGFSESAKNVKKALAARGISCPEVVLDGEYCEVYAVTVGKTDRKLMAEVISETLGRKYALKDKLDCDDFKSCLVFGAPPKLDAAFGVAYAIKNGEKTSGDTHSVVKISDHSFLMALSDGMGSGEYAHKVSEAAISLIEAFYRAEMPEDNVLNTINKLLSFNRDERFTCIDIAAVNLESGRADFVKIGSPEGIILREGEIKILESASLPLGILDNLKPTVCTEMLKAGDIVVFMSDGITSAFASSTDLYEFLQGFRALNPQNLADNILAAALEKCGNTATDDMTVLCTRIFENS